MRLTSGSVIQIVIQRYLSPSSNLAWNNLSDFIAKVPLQYLCPDLTAAGIHANRYVVGDLLERIINYGPERFISQLAPSCLELLQKMYGLQKQELVPTSLIMAPSAMANELAQQSSLNSLAMSSATISSSAMSNSTMSSAAVNSTAIANPTLSNTAVISSTDAIVAAASVAGTTRGDALLSRAPDNGTAVPVAPVVTPVVAPNFVAAELTQWQNYFKSKQKQLVQMLPSITYIPVPHYAMNYEQVAAAQSSGFHIITRLSDNDPIAAQLLAQANKGELTWQDFKLISVEKELEDISLQGAWSGTYEILESSYHQANPNQATANQATHNQDMPKPNLPHGRYNMAPESAAEALELNTADLNSTELDRAPRAEGTIADSKHSQATPAYTKQTGATQASAEQTGTPQTGATQASSPRKIKTRLLVIKAEELRPHLKNKFCLKAEQERKQLQNALHHLYTNPSADENEARARYQELAAKLDLCTMSEPEFSTVLVHKGKGRPAKNAVPLSKKIRLRAAVQVNAKKIIAAIENELLYVLAVTDSVANLSMGALHALYHCQLNISGSGYRINLQGSLADNVYMKNPSRMRALSVLLTMSLLVAEIAYQGLNLPEHRLAAYLNESQSRLAEAPPRPSTPSKETTGMTTPRLEIPLNSTVGAPGTVAGLGTPEREYGTVTSPSSSNTASALTSNLAHGAAYKQALSIANNSHASSIADHSHASSMAEHSQGLKVTQQHVSHKSECNSPTLHNPLSGAPKSST